MLSRSHPVCIIRHSGVVFEGEQGRKYAGVIGRIVESVQGGLEEISGEQNDGVGIHISWEDLRDGLALIHIMIQDEIKFLRIRTKRHELMISPGRS